MCVKEGGVEGVYVVVMGKMEGDQTLRGKVYGGRGEKWKE